ncbi:MAG: hypothetical protein Q4B13_05345 [Lautropia sp.]|nr:hypothetical protein [Lautropia sp.]
MAALARFFGADGVCGLVAPPRSTQLEHDKALNHAVLELLSDHTELFKQFSDTPDFNR